MTALRAHLRRRKRDAATDPGGPAPGAAAEVIQIAAPDRTQAAEAIAPVPLRTPGGLRLMAGLTWEIASGPETPVMRPNAPLVLRLPERRVLLARQDANGPASALLLAMAAALAHSGVTGPWVFLAELPGPGNDPAAEPLLWLAAADLSTADLAAPDGNAREDGPAQSTARPITSGRITPRPGPEQVFSDPDAALAALHKYLATSETSGLCTMWAARDMSSRGRLLQSLARIAPTLPVEEIGPEALPRDVSGDLPRDVSGDLPCFHPPRRIPARVLGAAGGGLALVLAAVFVVIPVVEAAFEPPPPPPPEMVSVRIGEGAFAAACTAALEAWWPRVVGWQLQSAGCALAGHLPPAPALPEPPLPARLSHPMVIWHHLAPEPGRNVILARSAAEQMIGAWEHEAQLTAEHLTFWQVAPLPMVPLPVVPVEDAERGPDNLARLSALWAERPGAVTREAQNFRVTPGPDASPRRLFTRAARVSGLAPVRLIQDSRTETGGQLVLAPVMTRTVPVTLLEPPVDSRLESGAPPSQGKDTP